MAVSHNIHAPSQFPQTGLTFNEGEHIIKFLIVVPGSQVKLIQLIKNHFWVEILFNTVCDLVSLSIVFRHHPSFVVQIQESMEHRTKLSKAFFEPFSATGMIEPTLDSRGCPETVDGYIIKANAEVRQHLEVRHSFCLTQDEKLPLLFIKVLNS